MNHLQVLKFIHFIVLQELSSNFVETGLNVGSFKRWDLFVKEVSLSTPLVDCTPVDLCKGLRKVALLSSTEGGQFCCLSRRKGTLLGLLAHSFVWKCHATESGCQNSFDLSHQKSRCRLQPLCSRLSSRIGTSPGLLCPKSEEWC
jgi:hypothetical protein